MPERNDHSRIEGKYNEWVVTTSLDKRNFVVVLRDGQSKQILLMSPPYQDKAEAQGVIDRATSGNIMQRFTDLT